MSSASPTAADHTALRRAEQLKHELLDFATHGPLKDEYERQYKLLFELSTDVDERDSETMRDWFLYDWFDENGEGVIHRFLGARGDLDLQDQDVLAEWTDSLNSVFEIRGLSKNALRLGELDSGDEVTVITTTPLKETPFKRGQFIAARLLPLGDQFIFSGVQFILPDRESALEALEVRRALEVLDSPEAFENAQREQCNAFCELFGCEEMTVPSKELRPTLQKFQQYIFAERRDPETGKTAAERFHEEFGRELRLPEMPPLPDVLADAGDVTILCDEFDGIVLLPDYERFRRIFESRNPGRDLPDWQALLWRYIKDPDIPIVAFERVAEQNPRRLETVIRRLTGKRQFSLEHLYALLIHYKEPSEEFDDLEDDQRLWDLFDGNGSAKAGKPRAQAQARKAPARKQTSKARAKASSKKSSAKAPARKAAKKSAAKKASTGGAKKASGKAAKKAASKGAKKTATKKRR
ncbi:MAG TPA: hypothetical protein VKA60_12960 [Blastocatellia bacterium]|nr:hypothetical protein [Blastocatellia bacterium]